MQSRLKTIGEAANYITKRFPEFVAEHQAIPFSGMYGMRNIIVHAYFKVDLKAIWNISQNDIPKLKEYLDSIDNSNNSTPTPPKP